MAIIQALIVVKNIRLITSGQTATEVAALEWAFEHGVQHGGWCPRAESKKVARLSLKETPRTDPFQAYWWNVWDADGMVIYGSVYEPSGLCFKAIEYCLLHHKPWIQLPLEYKSAVSQLAEFLRRNNPKTLNLVGSNVDEDELKQQLPLILTDAYSDTRHSPPTVDLHRSNSINISSSSDATELGNINLNQNVSAEPTFNDMYLSLFRTWEGNKDFAPQVEANMKMADPTEYDDSYMFHACSVWASLTQSNPSDAANHLRQIPEPLREHPFFTFLTENIYMASQDWVNLEAFTRKQIDWQPEKNHSWVLRSIALDKMGQTQAAYIFLLEALERFPNEFNFSYNLACFACKLGHMDEAWEWVEKAFHLSKLETFKSWLLTDDDLKPLREKISRLSESKLV